MLGERPRRNGGERAFFAAFTKSRLIQAFMTSPLRVQIPRNPVARCRRKSVHWTICWAAISVRMASSPEASPECAHLGEMSPRRAVHIVAQRIEPEPIEAAGFTFLKQSAVPEMSEETIGIDDLREPLAASPHPPLGDGFCLAQTGRGGRNMDEFEGRKLGESRQAAAQVRSEGTARFNLEST